MLTWPPTVRIFVSTLPADMRRSFDGLAMMAREGMGQDPLSGHLFVFFNRRLDRVKTLVWDRSGLVVWYKRLEKGRFRLTSFEGHGQGRRAEIEAAELALILEGIELANAKRRPRFTPRKAR